ncbi:stage II sporulation protein D [Natranaerovirga pectinivora]|uniref:Stage II sporulation protein D n=1 Tax=Natranaerovirga pectinivora TaxID=682400 RepID=A0A4R3MJ67_9FIRM|nr:stage II sporulation protein D [Natranaerovirga pectinivora]TCT13999.1 stage II sporulation protein D [Natranaerovirga pectinivora]
MLKTKLISGLLIIIIIISLPYFITLILNENRTINDVKIESGEKGVKIINELGEVEELGLEEYIIGVVAAEMPVSFEREALRAQAVAARTYAVKHMGENATIHVDDIYQSYISKKKMEEIWGVRNFAENYNKISDAVLSTRGEIIVYDDEPIEAVFHSTSAGRTQGAQDVWQAELPYLVSVDSSEDMRAPTFLTVKTFSNDEIIQLIKKAVPDFEIYSSNVIEQTQIIRRSEGGYITSMQIGNTIFTGEEIRNILSLKSSNFTMENYDGDVRFVSKGYGHGVGLSQYGANYMAEEGYTYEEILKHYYYNIDIVLLEKSE